MEIRTVLATCAAAWAAGAGSASGQGLEDVTVAIGGLGSVRLSAADVDGDGLVDVVTEVEPGDPFYVVRGLGDGSFAAPVRPAVPGLEALGAYAFGDVDGDGADELVAVVGGADRLDVYAFADDTFVLRATRALPGEVTSIAVGPIDRDGLADVVVTSRDTPRLHVFAGDPVEWIVASGDLLGLDDMVDVSLTDVDADGLADVLALSEAAGVTSLAVVRQTSPGRFATALTDAVPGDFTFGRSVDGGDVDGDGFGDATLTGADTLLVLRGQPDGTLAFGDALTAPGLSSGAPDGVSVVDVDGDGAVEFIRRDLFDWRGGGLVRSTGLLANAVSADFDRDGLPDTLLAQTGPLAAGQRLRGTGGAWREFVPFDVGASGVVVADVDGDGRVDLLRGSPDAVLIARGGVGDAFGGAEPLGLVEGVDVVAFDDIDLDGFDDIVATLAPVGETVTVLTYRGAGDGSFDTAVASLFLPGTRVVASGDFDGDGRRDVITLRPTTGVFSVSTAQPSGSFEHVSDFSASLSVPVTSVALHVADLDDDGVDDVVLVGRSGTETLVATLTGDTAGVLTPVDESLAPIFTVAAVGDVDGDGIEDLVTSRIPAGVLGELGIAYGNGDATFGPPVSVPSPVDERALAIGDVDGDGRADILTLGASVVSGEAFASALVQDDVGDFEVASIVVAPGAASLQLGVARVLTDVDGDGLADLVYPTVGATLASGGLGILRAADTTWRRAGDSLAGPGGFSTLRAEGSLAPGSVATIEAPNGPAHARAVLIAGLSAQHAPFLGGVLVPSSDVLLPVLTDADGAATYSFPWRDPPPGHEVFVQVWYPAAPASTIALRGAPVN